MLTQLEYAYDIKALLLARLDNNRGTYDDNEILRELDDVNAEIETLELDLADMWS